MSFIKTSEGVFYSVGDYFSLGDYSFLIDEARKSKKRRARICFHRDEDKFHQMLIVLMNDTIVENHAHSGSESQWLIDGHGLFEIDGEQHKFDDSRYFYYVRAGVLHRPIVQSEYMVVLESKESELQ